MRIHFERHGGFGGIQLKKDIDTDTLGREDGESLIALVRTARADPKARQSSAQQNLKDPFEYVITIEDGAQSETMRLRDGSISESAKALLQRLTREAKQPGPK